MITNIEYIQNGDYLMQSHSVLLCICGKTPANIRYR